MPVVKNMFLFTDQQFRIKVNQSIMNLLSETTHSWNSEPQNIEQEISNDEVWNRWTQSFLKNNNDRIPYFEIHYSLFDIRYSLFQSFFSDLTGRFATSSWAEPCLPCVARKAKAGTPEHSLSTTSFKHRSNSCSKPEIQKKSWQWWADQLYFDTCRTLVIKILINLPKCSRPSQTRIGWKYLCGWVPAVSRERLPALTAPPEKWAVPASENWGRIWGLWLQRYRII